MTLRTSDKIAFALFGRTKQRVLALLFGAAIKPLYLREVVRGTGSGVGAVQRELAKLTSAGLLIRIPEGGRVFFTANHESPVYEELRSLLAKTAGIADIFRRALRHFFRSRRIKVAFIYGSVAVGKHTSNSDIDLFVIGRISLQDLWPRLRKLQMTLGREINASVYSPEEFKRKYARSDHFIRRVVEKPKVMLLGTEDDIARLVGEPLARRA